MKKCLKRHYKLGGGNSLKDLRKYEEGEEKRIGQNGSGVTYKGGVVHGEEGAFEGNHKNHKRGRGYSLRFPERGRKGRIWETAEPTRHQRSGAGARMHGRIYRRGDGNSVSGALPHEKDKLQRRKKMEKTTANSLRQEAEKLGLRAGRRIDVIDSMDGEENERRRKRSGVVVRLFRHFFQCDMGGYTECFRYNTLLRKEMGEKVRLRGF